MFVHYSDLFSTPNAIQTTLQITADTSIYHPLDLWTHIRYLPNIRSLPYGLLHEKKYLHIETAKIPVYTWAVRPGWCQPWTDYMGIVTIILDLF